MSSDLEMQADSEGGGTPPIHSANKAMMRDESGKKAMCMDDMIRLKLSEPYDYPQSIQIIKRTSE